MPSSTGTGVIGITLEDERSLRVDKIRTLFQIQQPDPAVAGSIASLGRADCSVGEGLVGQAPDIGSQHMDLTFSQLV